MRRPVPSAWLAAALDGLAIALLAAGAGWLVFDLLAAGLHGIAAALLWRGTNAPRSVRALGAALGLTLPLAGVGIAALAQRIRGRGEIAQPPPAEPSAARRLTPMDVHRLTDGLPACEALASADAGERRATLAMLTRRADAASVGLLHWAAASADPDLAVEAALALEELSAQFEAQAAARRAALEAEPSLETALAAADALADAIHSGLPDAPLLAPLAAEARHDYEQAECLAGSQLPEVTLKRARFELDVMCPDAALEAIARGGCGGVGREGAVLRARAEAAAHRTPLPILEPQALAEVGS